MVAAVADDRSRDQRRTDSEPINPYDPRHPMWADPFWQAYCRRPLGVCANPPYVPESGMHGADTA
jgi:hypothetical protein